MNPRPEGEGERSEGSREKERGLEEERSEVREGGQT